MTARQTIESGKAILGIEFGSTRIKAVLIDQENKPIAQGSHEWENQLVDGLWTYSTEAIWYGVEDCYADLRRNVKRENDCEIEQLASIGISAMMHGYMAFGPNGKATRWAPVSESEKILAPFRSRSVGAFPTSIKQSSTAKSMLRTSPISPPSLATFTGVSPTRRSSASAMLRE